MARKKQLLTLSNLFYNLLVLACLIASWYLSCLLQFLVIGTIVIYVCAKNQKIGVYLVVILFVVSMIIPFAMTYYHRAYGIVRLLQSFLKKLNSSFEYRELYRPFYLRGTPFFAGILSGIIVEEMKIRKIKFNQIFVYLSTFVVIVVCLRVQMYGSVFYQLHRPYDVLEQSIYSTVFHLTLTTIAFWITLCHLTSGYGSIEKIFNNRLLVILGRLSYPVYLVNITLIQMMDGKSKTALSPTVDLIVDRLISIAFKSYLVGAVMYLTVDAPFGLLLKNLLYGKRGGDRDSRQNNTTNVGNALENEQKDLTHV